MPVNVQNEVNDTLHKIHYVTLTSCVMCIIAGAIVPVRWHKVNRNPSPLGLRQSEPLLVAVV